MATYLYRVGLSWDGPGSPGVNTWHFRQDDIVTSVQDVVDVIHQFYSDIGDTNIFTQSMVVDGEDVVINVADSTTQPVTFAEVGSSASGTAFAGPAQMICTLRTSVATRSGRGRKFIGPVSTEVMSADGTPTATAVGLLQDACDAMVASSVGLTEAAIGVYSPTESLFRDCIQMDARDYFAILRSRRD